MQTATIINRISASIAAGELTPRVADVQAGRLILADLLRPFDDVFPGMRGHDEKTGSPFASGGLRRPRLTPRVRRSGRPLQRPRVMSAPSKLISPGLFTSIRAIYEWYQDKNIAEGVDLQIPFDDAGLHKFLNPLWHKVGHLWPLNLMLENLYWDGGIYDLQGIHLMMPCWNYEEEFAGVVEAFLTGTQGVPWAMEHFYSQDGLLAIPEQDRQLIDKHGFLELVLCYAKDAKGRSYDLNKLEHWNDNFFSELWEKYPGKEDLEIAVISANAGEDAEVWIETKEDLDFCIEYHAAFGRMCDAMPDPQAMEENDLGITDIFIHELCEVWRTEHGLSPVRWTSPLARRKYEPAQ